MLIPVPGGWLMFLLVQTQNLKWHMTYLMQENWDSEIT